MIKASLKSLTTRLFLSLTLCMGSLAHGNDWNESLDGPVVSHFQNKKYIKGNIAKAVSFSNKKNGAHAGSSINRMLFITTKTANKTYEYAIKIFNEPDYINAFESDKRLINDSFLKGVRSNLKKFSEKYEITLPIVIDYIAAVTLNKPKVKAVLMPKAPGQKLSAFFVTHADQEDFADHCYEIGSQFGALEATYFNERQSILRHGDHHSENYVYDDQSKQLYWIDLARTTEEKAVFLLEEDEFSFAFSGESGTIMRSHIRDQLDFFRKEIAYISLHKDEAFQKGLSMYSAQAKKMTGYLNALKALTDGYLTQLKLIPAFVNFEADMRSYATYQVIGRFHSAVFQACANSKSQKTIEKCQEAVKKLFQ